MRILALLFLITSVLTVSAQSLTGDWYGQLDVMGNKLPLVLHITANEDDYTTTMDSPEQGTMGIPMDETIVNGDSIQISLAAAQIVMKGIYFPAVDSLYINFQQGPMQFPMGMSRQAVASPIYNRPQEPTDFPYQQEGVRFQSLSEDHSLAGTLTMPEDENFEQVVILVSGSGPQDRNEELLHHKPFLVLSDYLTRAGIAVLRYDDRGVGKSGGDFASATSADFAKDTQAALAFLRTHPKTQGKKYGIIGHSEGGMIAPVVATQNEVDFIVLLAGPGTPIPELLLEQGRLIGEANGDSAEDIALAAQILEYEMELIQTHAKLPDDLFQATFRDEFTKWIEALPMDTQAQLGMPVASFIDTQAKVLTSPWFRYFVQFDPAEYLRQIQCPVLAINGSLDVQVPAQANLSAIETALKAGGNETYVTQELPNLNHLFQTATTGSPQEYVEIEETFNEEAMEIIANWISELD